METIERYQPEFVARHQALNQVCGCPACNNMSQEWPKISLYLHNQQRDSLNPACETVARELLLNPDAFVLHTSRCEPQQECAELSPWDEMLNQQCINLAIHPLLSVEGRLYAIGVLLSKAQQYLDNGDSDPELLLTMSEQIAQMADQEMMEDLLNMLPPIVENRLKALKEMGSMRLNLNLPMAENMGMMLKLSELSIMPPSRLGERLQELESTLQGCSFFAERPHILLNVLIYRLYHDVFPGVASRNYGVAMLQLARDFFQLKMLSAIWLTDRQELSEDLIVMLFSAWFSWRGANPMPQPIGQSADHSLLSGLSLL